MANEIELLQRFRDEMPGPSTDAWARARSAVAVAQSEEEPTGPRRGRSSARRQLFSIAAVAGVAAAVAGLLAAEIPNSPAARAPADATAQQIQTTAYMTGLRHALAPPSQERLLSYARTVYPPGGTLVPGPRGQIRADGPGATSWQSVASSMTTSYGGAVKVSAFTATGQRVFDEAIDAAVGGRETAVTVTYRGATWSRVTFGAAPAPGPVCGTGVNIGPGGWGAVIRHELGCGKYTAAGRQRIDGIDAMKISGNKALDAVWVNPATFLPVRAVLISGVGPLQTDFRWLSPTRAALALAQLNVPIPAGFRQVPAPSPGSRRHPAVNSVRPARRPPSPADLTPD